MLFQFLIECFQCIVSDLIFHSMRAKNFNRRSFQVISRCDSNKSSLSSSLKSVYFQFKTDQILFAFDRIMICWNIYSHLKPLKQTNRVKPLKRKIVSSRLIIFLGWTWIYLCWEFMFKGSYRINNSSPNLWRIIVVLKKCVVYTEMQ